MRQSAQNALHRTDGYLPIEDYGLVGDGATQKFVHAKSTGGVLLLATTVVAMFFFVIGLEIKREFLIGEVASVQQAVLPPTAASGGAMLLTALYSAMNSTGSGAPGWGIPMATDIAFSLGILALLGSRVPVGEKTWIIGDPVADSESVATRR